MNLDWAWVSNNLSMIARLVGQHAILAVVPALAALVISIPLGTLVHRSGRASQAILTVLGILFSIPSLVLFVALPALLHNQILEPVNVAVALTIYSVALLVSSVVEGLRAVPATVKQSASALGFGRVRRLVRVELPLAMPAVFARLRVATVSNIALVSVAVLVGSGALGQLFTLGYDQSFYTPLITGLVLSVLLAVIADVVILLIGRGALPWARGRRTA